MREITGRRRRTHNLGEIRPAAAALQESLVLHFLRQSKKVYRFATLREFIHRAEYKPMFFRIKRVRMDKVQDVVNRIRLQKQGAKQRPFGLKRLRWDAVGCCHSPIVSKSSHSQHRSRRSVIHMISTLFYFNTNFVCSLKIFRSARRGASFEHFAYFLRNIRFFYSAENRRVNERDAQMRVSIFQQSPLFFGCIFLAFQGIPKYSERGRSREVVSHRCEESFARFAGSFFASG